jgi:hypothetical protein
MGCIESLTGSWRNASTSFSRPPTKQTLGSSAVPRQLITASTDRRAVARRSRREKATVCQSGPPGPPTRPTCVPSGTSTAPASFTPRTDPHHPPRLTPTCSTVCKYRTLPASTDIISAFAAHPLSFLWRASAAATLILRRGPLSFSCRSTIFLRSTGRSTGSRCEESAKRQCFSATEVVVPQGGATPPLPQTVWQSGDRAVEVSGEWWCARGPRRRSR